MIEFSLVPAHLVLDEIAQTVDADYSGIGDEQDGDRLNIDWLEYIQGGMIGAIQIFTARENEKLVAYAGYKIGTDSRKKHVCEAYCDGFFIKKEHRGIGLKFLKEAELSLKAHGVHRIHFAVASDRVGSFLKRCGHKQTFKIWSKDT